MTNDYRNTMQKISFKEVQKKLKKLNPPDCVMCDDHRLLTLDEVLYVTGYKGRATVYRWLKKGLRSTYTGIGSGGTRFAVSDIKDWLNQNKQERGSKNDITKN